MRDPRVSGALSESWDIAPAHPARAWPTFSHMQLRPQNQIRSLAPHTHPKKATKNMPTQRVSRRCASLTPRAPSRASPLGRVGPLPPCTPRSAPPSAPPALGLTGPPASLFRLCTGPRRGAGRCYLCMSSDGDGGSSHAVPVAQHQRAFRPRAHRAPRPVVQTVHWHVRQCRVARPCSR